MPYIKEICRRCGKPSYDWGYCYDHLRAHQEQAKNPDLRGDR